MCSIHLHWNTPALLQLRNRRRRKITLHLRRQRPRRRTNPHRAIHHNPWLTYVDHPRHHQRSHLRTTVPATPLCANRLTQKRTMLPRRKPHRRTLPLRIQRLRRPNLTRIAHRRLMRRRKPIHRRPILNRTIHRLRSHQYRHMLRIERMPHASTIHAPQIIKMNLNHGIRTHCTFPRSHLPIDRSISLHYRRLHHSLFKQCGLHRTVRPAHLKPRHKPFQQRLLSHIAQPIVIVIDLDGSLRVSERRNQAPQQNQQPKSAHPSHTLPPILNHQQYCQLDAFHISPAKIARTILSTPHASY